MASTREWFETVEEARRRARRRLPRSVYLALVAGTEKGVTLRDNTAAFSELRFTPPHIADLPATREMATSVLGQEIALPVIASPTGVQAVHPDGEAGVARGSAEAGTALGLSSFGSMPVETVTEVNPKLFFQTYWSGGRDKIIERAERARQAGAKGLIVTLDWSFSNRRDWGSPAIPEKIDLRTLIRLAPEGITRLGYVREWLKHGGLPARRRDPPRQRRGQGGGPRRAGGHDRPRLPVGASRQRIRGREERLRRAPRRHRLDPARAGPRVHSRLVTRRHHRPGRVQPRTVQVTPP